MVCCNPLERQERLPAKSNPAVTPSSLGFNSGDHICRDYETAIPSRSGSDSPPMAPLQGLKLEVLEGDGDTECAEYQTADNLKASRGHTSHHLLNLPLGRFSFRVTLENDDFQWHSANALQFLIDFDNRHHNLEVFVLRDLDYTLKPQQLHFLNSRGGPRMYTSCVTRLNHDFEERLTFENKTIEDFGTATSSQRQGTIWVMVKRCNLQCSKFDHTPSPAITTDIQTPSQPILESEGILSCIKLTGSNPRAIQRRMFKVVSSTPSASFIFHYRIPEEFQRIKSLDNHGNQIEEINPGVYRISSESVTKQETDQDPTINPQRTTWRSLDPRLPPGDTITLTPESTLCETDELEDLTALLDDIETKRSELSDLRQKHEVLTASKAEEPDALVEEEENLHTQHDVEETAFQEEK